MISRVHIIFFASEVQDQSPLEFWNRNVAPKVEQQRFYHAMGSVDALSARKHELPNYPCDEAPIPSNSSYRRSFNEQCIVCESEQEFENVQAAFDKWLNDQMKAKERVYFNNAYFGVVIDLPPNEFRAYYQNKNSNPITQQMYQVGKLSIPQGKTLAECEWEWMDVLSFNETKKAAPILQASTWNPETSNLCKFKKVSSSWLDISKPEYDKKPLSESDQIKSIICNYLTAQMSKKYDNAERKLQRDNFFLYLENATDSSEIITKLEAFGEATQATYNAEKGKAAFGFMRPSICETKENIEKCLNSTEMNQILRNLAKKLK